MHNFINVELIYLHPLITKIKSNKQEKKEKQSSKNKFIDIENSIDINNKEALYSNESKEFFRNKVTRKLLNLLKENLLIDNIELRLLTASDDSQLNYYQDELIFSFEAKIFMQYLTKLQILTLLNNFSKKNDFLYIWLSICHPSNEIIFSNELISSHKIKPISFAFGTIVDLSYFICHYHSYYEQKVSQNNKNSNNNNNKTFWVVKDEIKAFFQHDKSKLLFNFRITNGKQKRKNTAYSNSNHIKSNITRVKIEANFYENHSYQIIVKYSSITSIVLMPDLVKQTLAVYLQLHHPPLLYELEQQDQYEEKFLTDQRKYKQKFNNGHSTTNISLMPEHFFRVNKFNGISAAKFGKSNVFLFELPLLKNDEDFNQNGTQQIDPWSIISSMKKFKNIPIYFAHIEQVNSFDLIEKFQQPVNLPFNVIYALNSILSINSQILDELRFKKLMRNFENKIIKYSVKNNLILEKTFFEIFFSLDRNLFIRILPALKKIFKRFESDSNYIDKYNARHVQKIRRATLTPTRLIINPPQPFLESRFIRNSNPDFALRLTIRDDDQQSLAYTVCNQGPLDRQRTFLENSVIKPILNGIRIGFRKYEFLGSSTSQLRDIGMFLYAEDDFGRDAEAIRNSIGQLNEIRNVAKYVARVGLAFSQALSHIEIDKSIVTFITDIKMGRHPKSGKPYTFSDGIGMISPSLAKKVCVTLGRREIPSAYQIRYAGCKGMLTINPKLFCDAMIIRESMRKFKSSSISLEILKVSEPRAVYLNRPLITLLDQLNVPANVFLQMQMKILKTLTHSFLSEIEAAKLIKSHSSLQLKCSFDYLVTSGINILNEPFFRNVLDSLVVRCINDLKNKARIKVPIDSGRIMFGVLDDTDSLEYGEVFVQYSDIDDISERMILTGEVLVTKYPCMHPGDVRKLKAVDVPALHHMCDCIVFPASGPRPHPDEMAGSDLDGDEYSVIWYKPLLFPGKTHKPMDYPDSTPRQLSHEVTTRDILDFYASFIQDNSVGIIASAHLAFADQLERGVFDKVCYKLAEKYAVSLDFAKTGKNEQLSFKDRPTFYPDFMDKFAEKPTYSSKRALGLLYRQVCFFEICLNEQKVLDLSCEPNKFLIHEKWEIHMEEAINSFNDYKNIIKNYQKQFFIDSEAALLSGASINIGKQTTGRNEASDTHEMIDRLIKSLFRLMRENFESEFNYYSDSEKAKDLRMAKASAWYIMTYKLNYGKQNQYFGLPWIIADILVLLAKEKIGKHNYNETDGDNYSNDNNYNYHNSNNLKIFNASLPPVFTYEDTLNLCVRLIDSEFERILQRKQINYNDLSITELIDSVRDVLKNWLDKQKHLHINLDKNQKTYEHELFSVFNDNIIELLHSQQNENINLKQYLTEFSDKKLLKIRNHSFGSIIINVFKDLIESMFKLESYQMSNNICLNVLGLSALLTLNRFIRTKETDYIFNLDTVRLNYNNMISIMTFHLSLNYNERFSIKVLQNRKQFLNLLTTMSNVNQITIEQYEQGSNYRYLLLTASGTKWSLEILRNIISQTNFYKDVANGTFEVSK